ncbi:MAG: type II toxin-antitoxin system HicB family antitoxin [Mycobacteriales bacterium]
MTYSATKRRPVHVVVATVEQDEDGVWCASADMPPRGGANGYGDTREDAIADLREALSLWFSELGVPDELALELDDVD